MFKHVKREISKMLCINSFFGCNVFSPKINQNGRTSTLKTHEEDFQNSEKVVGGKVL